MSLTLTWSSSRVLGPDFVRPPRLSVAFGDCYRLAVTTSMGGYEWPPILELTIAGAGTRVRAVGTVMSMSVAPFLPRQLPLVVGTEQIAAVERERGRGGVTTIEPPVDIDHNVPNLELGAEFRREWGLATDTPVIVMVTRLAHELKLEGIMTAIRTIPGARWSP